MPAIISLTRALMTNRVRTEKKLRYLTYGSSVMVIFMMFYFTQTTAAQMAPSSEIVEFSAWRILAGLTFTIMAMTLSEVGSDSEQEFLASIGLRGSSYLWAKWLDLSVRSLPWFLWGASWGVATASAIPGRPFSVFVGLSSTLFLYAMALGGFLGFGLETILRKMKNGQRTSKGIAMFAPMVLVVAMMGMGRSMPVPPILQSLSRITPIGYYMEVLQGHEGGLQLPLAAVATVLPWLACMWLISQIWSFRREAHGFSIGLKKRIASEQAVRFADTPFMTKDLLMLRRHGFTLFRGVAAAAFLLLPFSFMNSQTDMPLFIRFFEVMIIVAASGMMFGLLLPAMDREVLWLIRVTGRLRAYVLQKFVLVSAITLLFSMLIIVPLTFTLDLPLAIVVPLAVVGCGLIAGLALIGSGIAAKMGIDMVSRPDANIVMGVMITFGFYLATTVLGYMVSWIVFTGFLAVWSILAAAALGVALYLFETLELA